MKVQRPTEDYLELIEEHQQNTEYNAFEKVLIAAQRAKKLHDLEKPAQARLSRKPAYQALLEIKYGLIEPTYEPPLQTLVDQPIATQEASDEE